MSPSKKRGNTKQRKKKPRILIITPEISYLPNNMGNMCNKMKAKAGGLADVSATLVTQLYDQGADVHIALPHYRRMFNIDVARLMKDELRVYLNNLSSERIHLAEDRAFYYCDSVYSNSDNENCKIALAFQREVINNIIPKVKPDLIHCNDWMTGLIPAYAKRVGIPCLFTIHNIHTSKPTMAIIEDRGIDTAEFYDNLYFKNSPLSYEESRSTNPVDTLNSGILASTFINTVSPTFLDEITKGRHDFIPESTRKEISLKRSHGLARGILNAPDAKDNPRRDDSLVMKYNETNHNEAKLKNKIEFQKQCGLHVNAEAPILFWPSRLDPIQKGCQLLSDILYKTIERYNDKNLQIAIVADGTYKPTFEYIVSFHKLQGKVAIIDFNDTLSHLGFGACDFVLMPSLFEPCGLPQMIGAIYGTLPIVHATGGLNDTVEHIDIKNNTGNGFTFKDYDSGALEWAIDEAIKFYNLDKEIKDKQIARIMVESDNRFNHEQTAAEYVKLYEEIVHQPIFNK